MTLHYLDNIVSAQTHDHICARLDAASWTFGHGSVQDQGKPFWKLGLDQDASTDRLWAEAKAKCESLISGELIVLRQYANGHTFGQGGLAHVDDKREGSYTLLYYPMREWPEAWGGETVFYGADRQIVHRVLPKPLRAILFDARVPHAGIAPNEIFKGLRKTIAFKLLLKSVFIAQIDSLLPPNLHLTRSVCEPFDLEAQQASTMSLKQQLLEQLAQSHQGAIATDLLARETQQLKALLRNDSLAGGTTDQEIQDIATHRIRSGLAILDVISKLGFDGATAVNEQRTLALLLERALAKNGTVKTELVSRQRLMEI